MAKNIILLGGSNSIISNGLQKGLYEEIKNKNSKTSNLQEKFEFYNFALGNSGALQSLYEIKRKRNQKALQDAELIIAESNVNDIIYPNFMRSINYLYEELYTLKKKILIIILPCPGKRVNQFHRFLSNKFNFNLIDMQEYYETNNLLEFKHRDNVWFHQLSGILRELGKNIIQNINNFKMSKLQNYKNTNPSFIIYTPDQLQGMDKQNLEYKNSMFNETVYPLKGHKKYFFNEKLENTILLGIHAWNKTNNEIDFIQSIKFQSSLIIQNKTKTLIKPFSALNQFQEIDTHFIIDKTTWIQFNEKRLAITETNNFRCSAKIHYLDHFDLVAFFLAKYNSKLNFDEFDDKEIKILTEYNFNFLIPPIEIYKEIIDEYCERIEKQKIISLKNEIQNLKIEILKIDPRISFILNKNLKYSAVARVKNNLSYRLGAAIIIGSKSLWGLISLPFILSFIKIQYNKEQKAYQALIKQKPDFKLPAIETYSDYKVALKEKECFTYQLGLAFIKAYKTWYKGGFFKFYFEAKNLKEIFKNNYKR